MIISEFCVLLLLPPLMEGLDKTLVGLSSLAAACLQLEKLSWQSKITDSHAMTLNYMDKKRRA